MIRSTIVFIVLLSTVIFAETVLFDTITVDSSSLRTFPLPPLFINTESIQIEPLDSIVLPPWRYYQTGGSIRFSSDLQVGTQFVISYTTEYRTIKRNYSLFEPLPFDSSQGVDTNTLYRSWSKEGSDDAIDFSGEKSVGAHLGSDGSFSIDQTLDVQIYGTIGDSTTLSANISDQSSSLQGDTKEIGSLDRIYLTVENPSWEVTAGDLEITTDSTAILREKKAPKGVSGTVRGDWGEANLFGAISGHRLAVEFMNGVSGAQSGTYRLRGNGEAGTVLPIEGTVELYVEGIKLQEGTEHDYTIDYDMGQIRFTPNFTILDDQLIEVRYRYRIFNYSKLIGGVAYSYQNETSPLTLTSSFIIENDDLSSNETVLTEAEKDSLINSGDSIPKILSGRKVNANDVSYESARNRLYRLDFENSRYIWASDPIADHRNDHYIVSFAITSSGGEYLPYNTENRNQFHLYDSLFLDSIESVSSDSLFLQPIYLFVGEDNGTHTAYTTATLPERLYQGEVNLSWKPSEQFHLTTTVAGKHRDQNTLSTIDDNDNNSAGFRSSLFLSSLPSKPFTIGTNVKTSYAGKEFINDITDRYSLQREWGINLDSVRYATLYGDLIGTINQTVSISAGTGVSHVEEDPFSQVFRTALSVTPSTQTTTRYQFQSLISDSTTAHPGRRQEIHSTFSTDALTTSLFLEEEWLERTENLSAGYVKGRAELFIDKINWKNSIEYQRNASGESHHISAEKVKTYFLWEQKLSYLWSTVRELTITSSLLNQQGTERNGTALLLSINEQSRHLDSRFATELNYTISSENSVSHRWQYIYVGEGVGTHSKDPITGEFLPDIFGDYIAQEITLWSDSLTQMIQNSFSYRWSYKTPSKQKVSAGLSLDGTLSSTEDIIPQTSGLNRGWIPFLSTIKTTNGDSLSYSTLQYTQRIQWNPTLIDGFSSRFTGTIYQKRDNVTEIRKIDGTIGTRKEWFRFALDGAVHAVKELRNTVAITDASVIPQQELFLSKEWRIFLEETIGYTALEKESGNYYSLRPGIRYTAPQKGNAELSYTVGKLNYDGIVIYPMAKDFAHGVNHRIYLNTRINAGKYFNIAGFFRADYHPESRWNVMTSLRATVRI